MHAGLLLCVLVLAASGRPIALQQPVTVDKMVSNVLPRMGSPDWRMRKSAFEELLNLAFGGEEQGRVHQYQEVLSAFLIRIPNQADRVQMSLIELLKKENGLINDAEQTRSTTPEGFSDYYANVIAAVAALKDERAIPALLGAIRSGEMATRALAEFGQKAAGPVLEELTNPDPMVRSAALFTIRDMEEMKQIPEPVSRARIKQVLLRALRDPDPAVRSSAIWVVATFGDKDFVPLIRKIAHHDPTKLPGQADEGGDFYPVRHAARVVLKKLEGH